MKLMIGFPTLVLKYLTGNVSVAAGGKNSSCVWCVGCGAAQAQTLLIIMASHGSNFIRLRLHFDYPPPAVVDCRMCWLLVDLNASRVVADLESVIREKFDFSRGSILSLFIDDCYLPHTESIYVVRDNDSVR